MRNKEIQNNKALIILNVFTFSRIILCPLIFTNKNLSYDFLYLLLFWITDSLDGYIARRYNLTSRFGSILDLTVDLLTWISFWFRLIYSHFMVIIWLLFVEIMNKCSYATVPKNWRHKQSGLLYYYHFNKGKNILSFSVIGCWLLTPIFVYYNIYPKFFICLDIIRSLFDCYKLYWIYN